MSSAAALEFGDLMNHRISVRSKVDTNDYGRDDYDDSTKREYICLVQVEDLVQRQQSGTNTVSQLTVYSVCVPDDGDGSIQLIKENDEITILTPPEYAGVRTINSVATYYDETGAAYCHQVRLA